MRTRKGRKFPFTRIAILLIPMLLALTPPDSNVNQRKIDRERARQEKKARKEYEKAVKQHNKNQSPQTKSMMKKARKDKKNQTPLKKSSGTKCK